MSHTTTARRTRRRKPDFDKPYQPTTAHGPGRTGPSSLPSPHGCPERCFAIAWSPRTRFCAGIVPPRVTDPIRTRLDPRRRDRHLPGDDLRQPGLLGQPEQRQLSRRRYIGRRSRSGGNRIPPRGAGNGASAAHKSVRDSPCRDLLAKGDPQVGAEGAV
jgi:hypothetical protein